MHIHIYIIHYNYKMYRFILLCICVSLSILCTSSIDPKKVDKRLSIYVYPYDTDSSAIEFYNGLAKQSVVPKEIIVKIMDLDESKKPLDKYAIYQSMYEKFDKEVFDLNWMINGYPSLAYNEADAQKIIDTLQIQLHKYPQPKYISIDVEPVIDVDTGLNLLPFLSKLIKDINLLKFPISVYVNPSCFSNPNGHIETKIGYNDFIKSLQGNSNNFVYLPAYLGGDDDVREDRISSSVSTFKNLGIKYKLIVDYQNTSKLKERLSFISKNHYASNGLAIYRLDKHVSEPPAGSMESIKSVLDTEILFLEEY